MPRLARRRSHRRRRLAIRSGPLLLTAVALVVSGCGSASDPAATVVGAAQKTAALSWVRYQVRFTGPRLFPRAVRISGARGAYDFRTGLDYAFIGVQIPGGTSRNVFVDSSPSEVAVAPSPAPADLLPAGKSWISAPLRGRQGTGRLVAQVQGLAPLLALDEIKWGTLRASSLGTRSVGHVPMNEYRVSVGLERAYSAATRHGAQAVAAAIEQELSASPSARVTIDVWVNGPGYVAQIFQRQPGSGLGATSLSFTSYARRYDGAFAPPSETVSLASLRPGRRSVWVVAVGS